MPMYTFLCRKCGGTFEHFCVMGTKKRKCPKCGGFARQDYSTKTIQLVDDSLTTGRHQMAGLHGAPWVDSKSGIRRAVAAHNRHFDTELVW